MVVAAFVVVVAGSLFTFVEALLEDVPASAVTDLVDDSDAFLQDSVLSVFGGNPPPCGPRVAEAVE